MDGISVEEYKRAARASDLEEGMMGVIRTLIVRYPAIPAPVREYAFIPGRKYAFDFAWPPLHVAIEMEGGIWTDGAHTRGEHFLSDCFKYNEAAIRGWCVLRFARNHLDDGSCGIVLLRALRERGIALPQEVCDDGHDSIPQTRRRPRKVLDVRRSPDDGDPSTAVVLRYPVH